MSGQETTFTAATILLVRDLPRTGPCTGPGTQDALEVLMVKRHHEIDVVAGAMVFPGGKVHDDDADPAWSRHVADWDAIPEVERAPRIAAIRECFEECGVIVGDPGDAVPGAEMTAARSAIDRRSLRFLDYVRRMRITIAPAQLTLFARWLTPPVVPKRFDTFFYLAPAPADQAALVDGREAVLSEWISPARALRLADSGARQIVFPTRMNLRLLAEGGDMAGNRAAAVRRPRRTVVPRIVTRGDARFLQLDAEDGYGPVEEPLVLA